MKTLDKLNLQLWLALILTISGIVMLFAGFLVPPLGIIDNSVLIAYGEISTFAGSLVGIDYSYKYKIFRRHKDN